MFPIRTLLTTTLSPLRHLGLLLIPILFFLMYTPTAFGAALCVTNPEQGLCPIYPSISATSPVSSGTNLSVTLSVTGIFQYDVDLIEFYAWMVEDGTGKVTELYDVIPPYVASSYTSVTINTGALTKSVTIYLWAVNSQSAEKTVSKYISVTSACSWSYNTYDVSPKCSPRTYLPSPMPACTTANANAAYVSCTVDQQVEALCECTDVTPVYSCLGTIPGNATMYIGDNTSLSASASYSYSVSNTATKCQYSCNSGYTWDGSSCIIPVDPTPIGSADSASCNTVNGWTCDPSVWAQSLSVHIYEGGTYVGVTTANTAREAAVGAACGNGTSAHGYEFTIPASYKNNATHNFTPYAIGINSSGSENGNNPPLGTVTMPACALPPATPTGLTVTPQACGTGQNFLDWNDAANAASYSIYNSAGTWIANSVGSNYTHTGSLGTAYSYYVRANNSAGTQSGNSAVASGTTAGACVGIAEPTNQSHSCNAAGTQVTVSWSAVTGATSYPLRVADTVAGCSDATLQGNSGNDGCISPTEYIRGNPGTNTTLTQTLNIQSGVAYRWWVHAYNGTWSASTYNNFTCTATTLPATPTGLTVTPQACGTGQNFLDWNDAANAASYSIYNSAGTWIANSVGSNYTHTGSLGTAYSYYVRANNSAGTQSGNSAVASGTTAGACVVAPTVPTVINPGHTTITEDSALLGATVQSNGGSAISARGTCWGATANPTTNCLAEGGTGVSIFAHTRTGFSPGATYYYRGYAENSVGRGYSSSNSFTTSAAVVIPPTPPTLAANPRIVTAGGATELTWTLNGQTGCTLTGGGLNLSGLSTNGNQSVIINARTTFTLSCGLGGSDSVTVEVVPVGFES